MIEEINVRLVITAKKQIFIRTENGFFIEKNLSKRGIKKLINNINNEEAIVQNEDDEVIMDRVIHSMCKKQKDDVTVNSLSKRSQEEKG